MRKVVFSPEAIADLEDIWLYIARVSLARADSFLDKLYLFCKDHLAAFPEIGTAKAYLDREILAFPYKNYMIYYRYQASLIEIIRILHGSRDLPAVFQ
ncbi:MAG: plasmid stabilization protein [Deltaproteobacteria bacterium]|nr:MAG: plasmid stabilization protein [Deltaproteobacteria bacterium]